MLDVDDAFPLDASESRDLDGDGVGDKTDTDIDGDGVLNKDDRFPRDANESVDTDRDGIGNNKDDDDDGDGLLDGFEENTLALASQFHSDPLKRDTDGDGVLDNKDAEPNNDQVQFDTDKDGVDNRVDNCPLIPNPGQANTDKDLPGGDKFGDRCDSDDDADGTPDATDKFPKDPAEDADNDNDRIGNNADPDDDNDGVLDDANNDGNPNGPQAADGDDMFPFNALEYIDSDGDGEGDNADLDDDNDGTPDTLDAFPLNPAADSLEDPDGDRWPVGQDDDDTDNQSPSVAFADFDGDGLADEGGLTPDPDDDNDGVFDVDDVDPRNAALSRDLDGDNIDDKVDTDVDGDGKDNASDAFPRNFAADTDTDGDGIPDDVFTVSNGVRGAPDINLSDPDDDNDGVLDGLDAFPFRADESANADGDNLGDNEDPDDDNDGVNDTIDAFPNDPAEQFDRDRDGVGDKADTCPDTAGVQTDTDGDGAGNPCDTDDDADGVADTADAFPLDIAASVDTDRDGKPNDWNAGKTQADSTTGLVLDDDDDNDGTPDATDAFPLDPTQSGDADGDGKGDGVDNCPNNANPGQENIDGDSKGDACDTTFSPVAGKTPASIQFIPEVKAGTSNINVRGLGNGNIYFFNLPNTGRRVSHDGITPFTWVLNGDDFEITYLTTLTTTTAFTFEAAQELVDANVITAAERDAFVANNPSQIPIEERLVGEVFKLATPANGRGDVTWVSRTIERSYPAALRPDVEQLQFMPAGADWIDRSSNSAYQSFTVAELTAEQWGAYLPVSNGAGGHVLAGDIFTFASSNGLTATAGLSFNYQVDQRGFVNLTFTNGTQLNLRKVEVDGNIMGVSYLYAPADGGLFADYRLAMPASTTPPSLAGMEDQFLQTAIALVDPDAYDAGGDLLRHNLFGFVLDTDGQSLKAFGSCLNFGCSQSAFQARPHFEQIAGTTISWNQRVNSDGSAVCELSDPTCQVVRSRNWQVLQQVGNRLYVLESDTAGGFPRLNFYEPYTRADLDGDNVDVPTDLSRLIHPKQAMAMVMA